MKYFVLKPDGLDEYARASRAGMIAYSNAIADTNPKLASELRKWVSVSGIPGGVTSD